MAAIASTATLDQQDAADREQRWIAAQLSPRGVPQRLHYAAGMLLDTRDFEDEQDYHRGRLGRALAALFGSGTLAGLRVRCPLATVGDNPGLEVSVAPGLALDRLGRLIEVRRTQCLKVSDWLEARARGLASAEQRARRDEVIAAVDSTPPEGARLLLDVWLRFLPAAQGRTPAFAYGPANATDANVPARLADGFEISLDVALDPTGAAGQPANRLPPLDQRLTELQALPEPDRAAARSAWMLDSVLDAWPQPPADAPGALPPLAEQRLATQWLQVYLARLAVPVKPLSAADAYPQIDADRLPAAPADLADNRNRPLVFIPTGWRGQTR